MITPNKYINFDKSIIAKMLLLIQNPQNGITVSELYKKYASQFGGIDEFMMALDVLYVLDKIDIHFPEGKVTYAEAN